jgi:S1/P1 Nuclease
MRSFFVFLLGLALVLLWSEKGFAWARQGHEVVAMIAERRISPDTRAKVNQLLAEGGDKTLVSVACWADDVVLAARGEGPLTENAEAQAFNGRFANSKTWHFINLPLGTMSFEEVRNFASSTDVVDAISRCIEVLESPAAPPQELTKVQALRLLVHFVADLHQPLHCGTGYYSLETPGVAQLVTYPGEAFGKPNDRGGNLLFYGTDPTEQLHAFWDAVIGEAVGKTTDPQAVADFLLQDGTSKEVARTAGDYHEWAQAWAVESVHVAALAYLAIVFEKAEFDANKSFLRINIKLPANYLEANKQYAADRLRKAGIRLAQLLDSIKWQSPPEP